MGQPWSVRSDPDGLATVTLNHPPMNLLNDDVRSGLSALVDQLESSSPRAVMFTAEGRFVSAGVDIEVFRALPDADAGRELFAELIQLAERVDRLRCPTVFVAHGLCLTWAFELALACDLIIAGRSAKFGLIEATVGLTPAMGGTQRLAERVGLGRARSFVMTAARVGAEELYGWGGIDLVVADDDLAEQARELAGSLASGPTLAHAATKDILRVWAQDGIGEASRRTPEIAAGLFDTADLRGALDSFAANGPGRATFTGR